VRRAAVAECSWSPMDYYLDAQKAQQIYETISKEKK
jgi:hypothetical protein